MGFTRSSAVALIVVSAALAATGAYVNAAGSGWAIQSTPHPTNAEYLEAVSCPSATSCLAVGAGSGTLAVRWNGTAWRSQTTPNPATGTEFSLNAVSCPTTTDCLAAGEYVSGGFDLLLAERWNGSQWRLQSMPTPSPISSQVFVGGISCAATSACMLVGNHDNAAGAQVSIAERWNGLTWTILSVPVPSGAKSTSLNGVSCVSSSDCVAVGGYDLSAGCCVQPLSERWNGTNWMLLPAISVNAASDFNGISCPSSTSCDAVGFSSPGTSALSTLAEHWNGSAWRVRTTPNPAGSHSSDLWEVSCPSSGSCTAAGNDVEAGGVSRVFAEGWNGTTWTTEAVPSPAGVFITELYGVSCFSGSACTAVGDAQYTDSRGQQTLAERQS
jgi:hypothetical protein